MNNAAYKSEKIAKIASGNSSTLLMNEDATIYEQIRLGDEQAFETLFKKYYTRLCHFVFQYVNNLPDAEEIAQETYLQIWDKREELEINTSIKSYIYASAKNKALNHVRNSNRRKGHLSVISSHRSQDVEEANELSVNEIKDQLFVALENLPPKCRKIFQMSRLEGLKHKEIAEQLGIKIKTVENQIGIALRHLKEKLSDYLHIIVVVISLINLK